MALRHAPCQSQSPDGLRFESSAGLVWPIPGLVGLIPGGFSYDGTLDAIAMTEHPHCAELVSLSLCNRSFACTPLPSATDQPTPVDVDGGDRSALLGG